jgi:hypothetical protein
MNAKKLCHQETACVGFLGVFATDQGKDALATQNVVFASLGDE